MEIVTIEQFNEYSGNYEEDTLKSVMLDAAQSIVETYIGYQLEEKTYIETITGSVIRASAKPITDVASVEIDEKEADVSGAVVDENIITVPEATTKRSTIKVEYTAGYAEANGVPAAIKMCILKIATLLLVEKGQNIAVTGITAPDGIGRTFVSYTHYQKHLQILNKYVVKKLW